MLAAVSPAFGLTIAAIGAAAGLAIGGAAGFVIDAWSPSLILSETVLFMRLHGLLVTYLFFALGSA